MRHLILFAILLMAACGEDSDTAYQRGYDDGISQVCYEIQKFNSELHRTLRREKICW